MIVNSNQFPLNIKKLESFNCYVFYGPNQGKSDELINQYIKMLSNSSSIPIDQINCNIENIKNSNFIEDYMYSDDIFGKKKVLIISLSNPDKLLKTLNIEKIINSKGCKIIIKTDELKKSSFTRKLFEKDSNLCIVASYEDSVQDSRKIISENLAQEHLHIDNSLINYLAINFKHNRNLLYQELEKIKLFLFSKGKINEKEFVSIVSESINFELEKLVYAIVSGKIKILDKLFNQVSKNGIPNLSIISAVSKHFHKILLTKSYFNEFNSYEKAIKSTYPPIFFKNEREYLEQVKNWPLKRIDQIVKKLLLAEIKIKSNPSQSDVLTNYILFSITRLANKIIKSI